jgi:hypothetical protein
MRTWSLCTVGSFISPACANDGSSIGKALAKVVWNASISADAARR